MIRITAGIDCSRRQHLRVIPVNLGNGMDSPSIALAAETGFTGVNISANGPGYRHLGGQSPGHFRSVGASLVEHRLKCELDTSDTRPEHLRRMLEVARLIGADQLRVYTRYQGSRQELIAWTIRDLIEVAADAASLGITIVLENHEDFQGAEIAQIVRAVNSPYIRALYDYGNSQMVGEEPIDALEAMLPFITAVHMKDHIIIQDQGLTWVQGVPLGQGRLPVIGLTQKLIEQGLRRFCFENVWAYVAPVQEMNKELPKTGCFELMEGQAPFNGDSLGPQSAVEGEYRAFTRGWQWLREALKTEGISISRSSCW